MQRHHQRPGALGRVIFRHVQREAAAAAGFVVVVKDSRIGVGGFCEARRQISIFAQYGIGEETADRRQFCGEGIQRLLRARGVTQRAKHRNEVTLALLYRAQSLECRQSRIACGP